MIPNFSHKTFSSAIRLVALVSIFGSFGSTAVRAQAAAPTEYDPTVCATAATEDVLDKDCLDMIKAFPKPEVQPIEEDKITLSRYSFWKVGPDPVNLYDGPGGNVVGQIPKGFNFINAIDLSVDGWIKTQNGKWISRADAKYAEASYFRGVEFTSGLKYDFAWVLDKSNIYASEYPGGPASGKTGRVLKRYELVNLYAKAKDKDGWDWYMIGPNQWVKQTFLARAHPAKKPDGVIGRWVAIDLYEQTLVAYDGDTPVYATLVSSGAQNFDTNEGLFKVWAKLDHDSMSGATGAPSAYALQTVPWVMYFDDSISLHGTYWHDLFGYRTSHGCVNLSISDASHLFEWFSKAKPDKDGKITNYVLVYSSGVYGDGVIREKS
jgi:hypothetical protein